MLDGLGDATIQAWGNVTGLDQGVIEPNMSISCQFMQYNCNILVIGKTRWNMIAH